MFRFFRKKIKIEKGDIVFEAGKKKIVLKNTLDEETPAPFNIPQDEVKLKEKIGKGSESEVWSATWNNQTVAVKQLKDLQGTSIELAVLNKATDAGALNIIKLYGYFAPALNQLSLVIEYMPLGSVFDYIDKESSFDPPTKLSVMCDMTQGVSWVHQLGYLHKDIKTLNFLLADPLKKNEPPQVKLCDFGFAVKSDLEKSEPSGTLVYAAPEIVKEQPITIASDIYSLAM